MFGDNPLRVAAIAPVVPATPTFVTSTPPSAGVAFVVEYRKPRSVMVEPPSEETSAETSAVVVSAIATRLVTAGPLVSSVHSSSPSVPSPAAKNSRLPTLVR